MRENKGRSNFNEEYFGETKYSTKNTVITLAMRKIRKVNDFVC